MIVREGNESDYQAVADYWNTLVGVENSIWRFAPTSSVSHIEAKINQGYVLYVAYENDVLVGYGIWRKDYMLGIAANNREIYWRIGREWAEQNSNEQGRVRFPNIVCNEITWFHELGVDLKYKPETWKPLKPGEDVSQRKVWTSMVTVNLNDVKIALDEVFGVR